MKKSKKLISAVLSGALALSMAAVGVVGAAASVDSNNYYTADNLPDGVRANRVYFLLPDSWVNATYNSDAGAYWWTGTGAGESADGSSQGVAWPGYRMYAAEESNNVYYIDVPTDVAQVVFNNYIDGGEETDEDFDAGRYAAAKQTVDVSGFEGICEGDSDDFDNADNGDFWSKVTEAFEGDDKTYLGDFADNFYEDEEYGLTMKLNNMIYVVDLSQTSVNELSGKETFGGRFYFYYGMNDEGAVEYGELPNYDLAKEAGVVYEFGAGTATTDEAKPTDTTPHTGTVGGKIYFDVKKSGWNNVKTVFCHIWRADGTGTWPQWQTKAERCDYDSSTGIATYDLSKTGNTISPTDGNLYCVIFSANTGMQTYNAIMSGSCIGDTMYCDGTTVENPLDSEKFAYVAVWANNPDCGPQKAITSTGNVIGTAYAEDEDDADLLAEYLIMYYNDTAKTDLTQNLINTLYLKVDDVEEAVEDKLVELGYNDDSFFVISAEIKDILAGRVDASDSILSGDVNTDGTVDISDATAVQKAAAQIIVLSNLRQRIADVNGDGVVDISDATMIQKYAAQVITSFPAAN